MLARGKHSRGASIFVEEFSRHPQRGVVLFFRCGAGGGGAGEKQIKKITSCVRARVRRIHIAVVFVATEDRAAARGLRFR